MCFQIGARLISRAGSLTNLAKFPASTIQILGAEKALFRALKTRSNTPKHGLLFHSAFIGKAVPKNKGRISRFVANKCAIASRIDCFSDVPVPTFGEFLKKQVEERLAYFDTGTKPHKNVDVMAEATLEADAAKTKVNKRIDLLGWPKNRGVFPHENFLNNPIKTKSIRFPPKN
jgi:RNA processing factor Prp31